ncbi:DNA-directed RNA polymerase subunit alpha C-terminal domain-containing protein [Viridibacillus sp. NPDC093762]|uniref:DNA-directed RNA polymerase subunit alpha C-terminal domain-containing protein n=1 Tax=Viridibacillus sp. NPDC093762 TaxID=3390720 RepID=UPI003D02E5AA
MQTWPKGVSKPAVRALNSLGITTLEQLTTIDEKTLKALHGMGPKSIRVLKESLHEMGLQFKD